MFPAFTLFTVTVIILVVALQVTLLKMLFVILLKYVVAVIPVGGSYDDSVAPEILVKFTLSVDDCH